MVGGDAIGVLTLINYATDVLFVEDDEVQNVSALSGVLNAVVRKLLFQPLDQYTFISKAYLLRGGVLLKHFLLFLQFLDTRHQALVPNGALSLLRVSSILLGSFHVLLRLCADLELLPLRICS